MKRHNGPIGLALLLLLFQPSSVLAQTPATAVDLDRTVRVIVNISPANTEDLCPSVTYDPPGYLGDAPQSSGTTKECKCWRINSGVSPLFHCSLTAIFSPELASARAVLHPKSFSIPNPQDPTEPHIAGFTLSLPLPTSYDLSTPPPVLATLSAPSIRMGSSPPPIFVREPSATLSSDVEQLFGLARTAWKLYDETRKRATSVWDAQAVYEYLKYSSSIFRMNGMLIADNKSVLIKWMDDHPSTLQAAIGPNES